MLGGDDNNDDLADLLAECGNQVNPPVARGPPPPLPPPGTATGGFSRSSDSQRHMTSTDATVKAVLDQNNRLMEALLGQSQESEGKRKTREVSYSPQEPVLLLDECYRLEDDAHDKIDTKLRQKLRPINVSPENYWVKGAFKHVEQPILGAALFTEHLMPNHVNKKTICKMHLGARKLESNEFLHSQYAM